MIRHPIRLASRTQRELAASYILEAAPDGCVVEFKEEGRTLEQNEKMWASIDDVRKQIKWRDWQGRPITMNKYEWKDFLWSTFKADQRMVMGIDGRSFVLVRESEGTSKAGKREMGEFLTFIEAFGAERGVAFSAPAHLERGYEASLPDEPCGVCFRDEADL